MENAEVLAFKTGKSTLFVYRSQYAGTNMATAVTFVAPEVEELVQTLKSRGVTFEHYRERTRHKCRMIMRMSIYKMVQAWAW
jgi:hypothetical protein